MSNALIYNPNTWLDQFFSDFEDSYGAARKVFNPAVDVVEDKEEFILRAELPGVPRESLKVEVKENHLTLSGKKESPYKVAAGEKAPAYRYAEAAYGAFSRSFELPRGVQGESIKAEFKDGVLSLRVPKAKEALPKAIEIG